jgi:wyosine [tRNA(Phe)-imidazoG37] synthetase (radical SAM superfamily)
MSKKNYFCQQKFDWVEIRLYDGFVSSCCQATPSRLRLDQITSDPIGFFNFKEIINERKMMLENQRIPGCESCWAAEDLGLMSRRIKMKSADRIYDQTNCVPKTINLIISNTCNQTCVYCCKNFSSSWLNDIIKNGDYDSIDQQRYSANAMDKVLVNLSQHDLYKSKFCIEIMKQMKNCAEQVDFTISGGEPFLDNHLVDIVKDLQSAKKLRIVSGLSVNSKRLEKMCKDLHSVRPDIHLMLSIENIGLLHEFNRFGSRYQEWIENYNIIRSHFSYNFNCVVSNLTIFGLADFLKSYPNGDKNFIYLTEPTFLTASLIDDRSKLKVLADMDSLDFPGKEEIKKFILADCDLSSKTFLANYLKQFVQRRSLDLSLFPETFVEWVFDSNIETS